MEEKISDLQGYVASMAKSLEDKLFFMDKIKPSLIVDFGCADGAILRAIRESNPNIALIGYDIDYAMIDLAKRQSSDMDIIYTDSWDEVKQLINGVANKALLLSSVIHEIYSYTEYVEYFWKHQVFGSEFDYIIIRDMMVSESCRSTRYTEWTNKILNHKFENPSQVSTFTHIWGNIGENLMNTIHLLLKYRYIANWDREVIEDYLPIVAERLSDYIAPVFGKEYFVYYKDHFVYPFLRDKVKEDFDIDLNEPTHMKMILKRFK